MYALDIYTQKYISLPPGFIYYKYWTNPFYQSIFNNTSLKAKLNAFWDYQMIPFKNKAVKKVGFKYIIVKYISNNDIYYNSNKISSVVL